MADSDRVIVDLDLDELFKQMNETTQVEAALLKKATGIAARARRLDATEGKGTAKITITEHWMRNGRRVLHVESNDVDGEYGTSATMRRRTLRRAKGQ